MTISINASDPLGSLRQQGIQVERVETSSSTSFQINGIPVTSGVEQGARYTFTGVQSELKVVFQKEGVLKKIVKIFSSELQTGDQAFDQLVYINTNDKEKTGTFLQDEGNREIIAKIIGRGGNLSIDGDTVVSEIPNDADPEELIALANLIARASKR
jgi:hypothetical protein